MQGIRHEGLGAGGEHWSRAPGSTTYVISHESTSPSQVARASDWERPRGLDEDARTKFSLAVLIALLVVAVAVLDFATSAQFIASILFTLPLSLCALQRSRRMVWGTAALASLLTIAAEAWGRFAATPPTRGSTW